MTYLRVPVFLFQSFDRAMQCKKTIDRCIIYVELRKFKKKKAKKLNKAGGTLYLHRCG